MFTQAQLIGIEAGKRSIRLALLKKTRGVPGWTLLSHQEYPLSDDASTFCNQCKEALVISALPTKDLLMRPCTIPVKKKKDVFAALDFYVEPLLPYPLEKAITQAKIFQQKLQETALHVFSVRKDHLAQHLQSVESCRIQPEVVTSRAHALAAFSKLLPQAAAPMLLVHESMDELSFVLVESGKLLALRSLEASYTSVAEIHKTLLYFTSLYPTLQVETIYFIGGDKKIQEDLQEAAGKPVLLPTHFPFSLSLEETVQYSVAIGAALAQQEVNFRQKEYAYPHPLRRYRKPLALFFSLSLTAAAVMILATQYQFRHQRSRLTEHYHALVKHENIDSSPSPLHSPEDFTRALQACEKTLRAKPDTFPLYPRVPKCREVMQWLTTIALPNGEEEPLLVVDSLHYQMVRRPEFTHKRDKYRVRLDLEITLRDAHAARSIQEALKDPDSLVDTTEDMQWVPVKGKYKVSCFLKDKTKYN